MRNFENKVIAITGAGSGIGRTLAVNFARRGALLALSDVDEGGLLRTAEQAKALGVRVETRVVDVAVREEVMAWKDQVVEHFGAVHVLVNNAGVSLTAAISDMSPEDFQWLMNINFWGVVHGTQAFLPALIACGDAHIVNLSSIFGIMAVPTQSAYNAAKFAVKGFSEALRMEMKLEGQAVAVTCVHPGGIRTNIARSARYTATGKLARDPQAAIASFERSLARNTPEYCAEQIVEGVQRKVARLMVGGDARAYDWLVRWFPQAYQALLVWDLKRRWSL